MHYLRVCGAAGRNKPVMLPVVQEYNTYNHGQFIILDNDDKQLVYFWLMYLLYIIIILFLVIIFIIVINIIILKYTPSTCT